MAAGRGQRERAGDDDLLIGIRPVYVRLERLHRFARAARLGEVRAED